LWQGPCSTSRESPTDVSNQCYPRFAKRWTIKAVTFGGGNHRLPWVSFRESWLSVAITKL
jgi:hypothetical protein